MAYRDFTFERIRKDFGLRFESKKLFVNIKPLEPSVKLLADIDSVSDMLLNTEKLVSEALVFPILQDIRLQNRHIVRLFSGEFLNVDKKRGLNGECDFILTKDPNMPTLHAPIISVAEAKKGDIEDATSLAQTVAQMIGARVFNQKEDSYEIIHGACTSGKDWIFLKLEEDVVYIDTDRYGIQNLPLLLGVLQEIVDFYA